MIDTTAGDASQETADDVTSTSSTSDDDASQETPTVDELQAQLDEWKSHARKHESRAKENHSRAKDFEDALTETEERALRLERELAEAKAQHVAVVRDALIGIHKLDPATAKLLTADTLDGLQEQVEVLLAVRGAAAGPTAPLEGRRPLDTPPENSRTFGGQLARALRGDDF